MKSRPPRLTKWSTTAAQPTMSEGLGSEVDPGHGGAQPRQRDRVGADVALQMEGGGAGEVAEALPIEHHDARHVGGVVDVAIDAVPVDVAGDPIVPVGPVGGALLVHGHGPRLED